MGRSTDVYFHPGTRYEDVRDVLSMLFGAEVEWWGDGKYRRPNQRLDVKQTHTPTMIVFRGTINDSEIYMSYFFEYEGPLNGPGIICGFKEERRPLWEALADIFGALVDLNDSDEIAIDFIGDVNRANAYRIDASDDEAWHQWRDAIYSTPQAITSTEWNW